jgi:anti-sigma factor RsiW
MNCADVRGLLQPYTDGELDLVRRLGIETHLAGCAACAEQERRLRSLRSALSSPGLYHRAPTGLRARLQRPPTLSARTRIGPGRLVIAAGLLLLLGATATFAMFWPRPQPAAEDLLAEKVVAGHLRSLQVDHLTDVASSDKHTVKPWFQGKLDFSPQVPDLSSEGYDLSGGRLDYLADRPVAALVYQRRIHRINAFTWPALDNKDKPVQALSRRGFHLRSWQRSGMTWWAISDLNDQELDQFVRLLQEQDSGARP